MNQDERRGQEDQVIVRGERDSEDGSRQEIGGEALSRGRPVRLDRD